MSEKTPHRRPATFKLGDPGVVVMGPDETGRPARGTVHITPEADPATLPVPVDAPRVPARRGFRWGTLFWSAAGGLVLHELKTGDRIRDRMEILDGLKLGHMDQHRIVDSLLTTCGSSSADEHKALESLPSRSWQRPGSEVALVSITNPACVVRDNPNDGKAWRGVQAGGNVLLRSEHHQRAEVIRRCRQTNDEAPWEEIFSVFRASRILEDENVRERCCRVANVG